MVPGRWLGQETCVGALPEELDWPGRAVHPCNPGTQSAETEGS